MLYRIEVDDELCYSFDMVAVAVAVVPSRQSRVLIYLQRDVIEG